MRAIFMWVGAWLFLLSLQSTVFHAVVLGNKNISNEKKNPEWVVDNPYRITITIDPGSSEKYQTPVSVQINFTELIEGQGIRGNLDRNSIRVVRYDPASGRAIPYGDVGNLYPVPHQLSRDFFYQDGGKIWWRIKNERETHFHIYFDILNVSRARNGPEMIALIGIGDNFHFNNAMTEKIDVSMSASAHYVDWDGDGKRDLLIGSHQTQEYGMFTGAPGRVNKYIYFYRNIGTIERPLFAPGYPLKDRGGGYVFAKTGSGYSAFEIVDWNNDGQPDILTSIGETLYLYENTGLRDRNRTPVLKEFHQIVRLSHGNDFTDDYNHRSPRLVDWDGDGDLDILYPVYRQHIEPNCKGTDRICYWDEVLLFFEVHENKGRDKRGQVVFNRPKVVRTARGILLTSFGYGGGEYKDWNGDGKFDLIVGDMWNYPQGASRVLFYENAGSRQEPKFLLSVPIVKRAEDFEMDPTPMVDDWDGDGDQDLILFEYGGWAKVFKNVNPDPKGLPQLEDGEFVRQVHPKVTGGKMAHTAIADWDGDGLRDLVQGNSLGWVTLFKNVGTPIDPVFDPGVRLKGGGQPIRMINGLRECPQGASEPNSGSTVPVVEDLDGDGDLDLIVGDMRGYQTYFENIGSPTQPSLAAGRMIQVGGQRRSFGWRNQLGVGDLNGDGQMEIISTTYSDRHIYSFKVGPRQDDPKVLKVTKTAPLRISSGQELLPAHAGGNNNGDYMIKVADWDRDGDFDLFVGSLYHIWYYENVGTKSAPTFMDRGRMVVEGRPLLVSNHAGSVEVIDWNGDGWKDLIIGGESGWTYYFERSFIEGKLPHASISTFQRRPSTLEQKGGR
jgi:hypothetical protein